MASLQSVAIIGQADPSYCIALGLIYFMSALLRSLNLLLAFRCLSSINPAVPMHKCQRQHLPSTILVGRLNRAPPLLFMKIWRIKRELRIN